MPLKPSHNLLVRGSNPCGGTTSEGRKQEASDGTAEVENHKDNRNRNYWRGVRSYDADSGISEL